MKEKKHNALIDVFTIGFALFAVFFGAGNLIFPPAIGVASGTQWLPAIGGLSISAILLPILTVIAINNMGGELDGLCKPVAPWFSKGYMILFIIFIGMVGVPRQGGTAIESGLFGLFPKFGEMKHSLLIGLILYFAIVFYLNCNPTKIVDRLGKVLTPILLISLAYIVIMAVVRPIGTPADTGIQNAFSNAFLTGYQTGDVVVGIGIAAIFIDSIKEKGFTDEKSIRKMTLKAAVVAFVGLAVVYGGLLYLGATGNTYFAADMDQTALLVALVKMSVGTIGSGILSIAIFLACLTTTTGVISSMASMAVNISKGKIPYKVIVVFYCLVGLVIGTVGVSSIISFSYPTFFLIYPVAIVLTLLGVFKKYVPNHGAWKGAVLMAVIVGFYDAVNTMVSMGVLHLNMEPLQKIYDMIPLSGAGMAWLIPGLVGFVVGALIVKCKGQESYPMLTK